MRLGQNKNYKIQFTFKIKIILSHLTFKLCRHKQHQIHGSNSEYRPIAFVMQLLVNDLLEVAGENVKHINCPN